MIEIVPDITKKMIDIRKYYVGPEVFGTKMEKRLCEGDFFFRLFFCTPYYRWIVKAMGTMSRDDTLQYVKENCRSVLSCANPETVEQEVMLLNFLFNSIVDKPPEDPNDPNYKIYEGIASHIAHGDNNTFLFIILFLIHNEFDTVRIYLDRINKDEFIHTKDRMEPALAKNLRHGVSPFYSNFTDRNTFRLIMGFIDEVIMRYWCRL